MTPMVDLAFLLVTFFMLTTKFRAEEPVQVDTPSSVTEIPVKDSAFIKLTVSNDGKVFFDMDNKLRRRELIETMNSKYNLGLGDKELNTFSILSSFGEPMKNMKSLLDMPSEARQKIKQPGIPSDSTNNELDNWIAETRALFPGYRISLKGDKDTHYEVFHQIVKTLIKNRAHRFNLVTNMEKGPLASK
jgi:biopolymer transport protein ExbD